MAKKKSHGQGYVFKRGRRWYVQFSLPDGKRITRVLAPPNTGTVAKNKSQANILAPELIQAHHNRFNASTGGNGGPNDSMTLDELDKLYLSANKERITVCRNRQFRERVMKMFKEAFPTVDSITQERLGMLRSARLGISEQTLKPRSPQTVNIEFKQLTRLLNWAHKSGYISTNPAQSFEHLKVRKQGKRPGRRELTNGERYRLLREISKPGTLPHVKFIVLFSLYMGMRPGEIFAMRWEHLGDKFVHIPEAKSGKPRDVPIPGIIKKRIGEIPRKSKAWVFPSCKITKGRALAYNPHKHIGDIKNAFESLTRRAKIETFELYGLRHTFITRQLNHHRVPPTIVKDIVGHSNLQTTMIYYHGNKELAYKWMNGEMN